MEWEEERSGGRWRRKVEYLSLMVKWEKRVESEEEEEDGEKVKWNMWSEWTGRKGCGR